MDKATIKAINTLSKNIGATANLLTTLKNEYDELRLKALRTVESTKVGDTITLEAGNRVIKAKKPARYNDRWNLTENGKRIATEYFGGIHDIRFDIAMGKI